MKVRNQAKLVRLEGERRQYIKVKTRLRDGRMRASLAQRPGGARGNAGMPGAAEGLHV